MQCMQQDPAAEPRRAAAVDCGHPPHACGDECNLLEDSGVVNALAYTALMAFEDRAAALSQHVRPRGYYSARAV